MMPQDALGGRRILLATEDSFLFTYLSFGFRQWGIEVVGPLQSTDELLRQAEAVGTPSLACVSVNLAGLERDTQQQLARLGTPSVLFGIPASPSAVAASILWPFSAFQVAQELALLVANASRPDHG